MPRGARLDEPGALHHVMVRGIDRTAIVVDDEDRQSFLERIGKAAEATGTTVYAWSLMTNHAHFLLRSGHAGLPSFMQRLLTGYSVTFNKRHKRVGHLFQNRYKSILCEEEPYFVKLVSYIHLNPFRAGLVGSLEELELYPWSGHMAIMGLVDHAWQNVAYVLQQFSNTVGSARKVYQEFMLEQSRRGRQPELTGGGLVRSAGGWSEVLSMRQRGERQFSDERILGGSEFVEDVLGEVEGGLKEMVPVTSTHSAALSELERHCAQAGLSKEALQSGSRSRRYVVLRRELAQRFVLELGFSHADTARMLGISRSAVSQMFRR
jgi:putative transposase